MTDCNIISHRGTINFNCSDHLPTFVVLKKAKEVYQSATFQGRSYHHYDKEAFQRSFSEFNWGCLYGCLDVNDAWEIIFKKSLLESDRMCPVRKFYIRKDHPPWFSTDILEMAANRDSLYKEARQCKDLLLYNEARKLKNLIKHRLANIKSEYFLNELKKNEADPKKFWCTFDEIIIKQNKNAIEQVKSANDDTLLNSRDF